MSVSVDERLTSNLVDVATARLPVADGGARTEPGFYAWWLTDKLALPMALTSSHPARPDVGLLYIGIAPNGASSSATIRSRILTNHLGNALGSSTLRRSLAALLWEGNDWHPYTTPAKKPALPPDECVALTRWMTRNLLVSWCGVTKPWEYEPTLIAEMAPPLNSDHNHGHAFYPELSAAREYMMAVARATAREPGA